MKKMNEVGCAGETALLDEFFETLRTDFDKVCYGVKTVCAALDQVAVKNLLISDHLFRSKNIATRKQYVSIAEDAEKNGIKVSIFGSQNPSGQRLKDMTGICAILKFAIPELDEIEEDEENDSDDVSDDNS
jgi:protein pelota